MISYREKQLLSVQKYILDESVDYSERLSKLTADMISGAQTDVEYRSLQPVSDFTELAAIAEKNGYDLYIRAKDLLSAEELADIDKRYDEINAEFSRLTGLKKVDWIFLVTAVALQCIRQYVLGPIIKKQRPNAGPHDEGNNRKGDPDKGWYYAPTESILVNKVPFDAQKYNKTVSGNTISTLDGFLKGAKDHRYVTLGHDPLLGWIFGTVNILTNTLTRYDLKSAHVKYKPGIGPYLHSVANTPRIFTATTDRAFHSGMDGKIAVGSALLREAIHLKSDINTSDSLALPGVSMISPKLAENLSSYGINMASVKNVGKEIFLSCLINTLISMVHRLFYDASIDDKQLFEVRTRKILLYSNLIASSSNLIVTAITKNTELLDIGGLIVTIIRLFKDIKFITKVKKDFIESKIDAPFRGTEAEMDMLYLPNQHIELF